MSRRTTSSSRATAPRHAADQIAPDWAALERWAHPNLLDRIRDSPVAKSVLGTLILGVLIAGVIYFMFSTSNGGTVIAPAAAGSHGSTELSDPTPNEQPATSTSADNTADTAATTDAPPAGAQTPLIVYVTGQVATPGVVQLPPGARVHDALQGAGGPTKDADLAALNLARSVQDGEHIHVVMPGEDPPASAGVPPGTESGSVPSTAHSVTSGTAASDSAASSRETARININTAELAQLQELPGVGPSIGQRIIDHRDVNGPFRTVQDLLEVKGIGPATLDKIRERATV